MARILRRPSTSSTQVRTDFWSSQQRPHRNGKVAAAVLPTDVDSEHLSRVKRDHRTSRVARGGAAVVPQIRLDHARFDRVCPQYVSQREALDEIRGRKTLCGGGITEPRTRRRVADEKDLGVVQGRGGRALAGK